MTEKRWPDVLTQSTTLYDLSVTHNLFPKTEIYKFGAASTQGVKTPNLRGTILVIEKVSGF